MKTISKAEPRWDRDLKKGKQAELQIDDFLKWIAEGNGCVETKCKSYLDHKLYVETHCDKGRTGNFEPSGINVTAAHMWAFVVDDTGIHIAIPTDILREALNDPSTRDKAETDGNCPTRGKLVDFCVLLFRLKQKRDGVVQAAPKVTPDVAQVNKHAPITTPLLATDIPFKGF